MSANLDTSPAPQPAAPQLAPVSPEAKPVEVKSLFSKAAQSPTPGDWSEEDEARKYGEYEGDYQEINRAAIVTLVLGVISLVAVAFPTLLVIPLAGVLTGAVAWWQLANNPEQAGVWLNKIGLWICGICFVGGSAWHTYDYMTELPDGYERISFYDLQPEAERPDVPIPPFAIQHNGTKVFIKGYVFPGEERDGIKTFILVPDMGTCCFGGNPKSTDMIQVTLKDPTRISYSMRLRKLGGTFHVDPQAVPMKEGLNVVYYRLEADHLQ